MKKEKMTHSLSLLPLLVFPVQWSPTSGFQTYVWLLHCLTIRGGVLGCRLRILRVCLDACHLCPFTLVTHLTSHFLKVCH